MQHVKNMSQCFFGHIHESSLEFRRAVINTAENSPTGKPGNGPPPKIQAAKLSSFMSWVETEVNGFAEKIEKQVFSPSTPLDIIAACVGHIREQAEALQRKGLDLTFLVDALFRRNIERTVSWCKSRLGFE